MISELGTLYNIISSTAQLMFLAGLLAVPFISKASEIRQSNKLSAYSDSEFQQFCERQLHIFLWRMKRGNSTGNIFSAHLDLVQFIREHKKRLNPHSITRLLIRLLHQEGLYRDIDNETKKELAAFLLKTNLRYMSDKEESDILTLLKEQHLAARKARTAAKKLAPSKSALNEQKRKTLLNELEILQEAHPEICKQLDTKPKSASQLDTLIDRINSKIIQDKIDIDKDYLDLEEANITRVPASLIYNKKYAQFWAKLRYLSLQGNYLQSLPTAIGKLQALISLDLSYNLFTSLPEALKNLDKLTWLNLNCNAFTSLPKWLNSRDILASSDLSLRTLTPQEVLKIQLPLEKPTVTPKPTPSAPPYREIYNNIVKFYHPKAKLKSPAIKRPLSDEKIKKTPHLKRSKR